MSARTRKQQLEELLAQDPNDPFLRYGLALEWASEGNEAQAVRQLLRLIEDAPDYVPGYQQAGQFLLRMGRTTEARDVLGRGVRQAAAQGDAHAADEMRGLLASLPE
jgi:predicted Zn-dependent protease